MELNGKKSVYLTIAEGLEREIRLGIRREGEKLPSCRELAMELAINPNTVQRAYSALEEKGVIYTLPKKGVYVGSVSNETESVIRETIGQWKREGIDRETIGKILDAIYQEEEK